MTVLITKSLEKEQIQRKSSYIRIPTFVGVCWNSAETPLTPKYLPCKYTDRLGLELLGRHLRVDSRFLPWRWLALATSPAENMCRYCIHKYMYRYIYRYIYTYVHMYAVSLGMRNCARSNRGRPGQLKSAWSKGSLCFSVSLSLSLSLPPSPEVYPYSMGNIDVQTSAYIHTYAQMHTCTCIHIW